MEDAHEFDLDALVAERAPRKPFTFRFGGESYTLPAVVDVRAAAALSDGDLTTGLRYMLGAEQWERLAATEVTFDIEALNALLTRYGDHVGASVGESSASTGSSKSTGRRSKPTSNGSTEPTLVR